MSKRNYKELWQQLKVIVLYGKSKRYGKVELLDIMGLLELGQLAQDPMSEILKVAEVKKEK